MNEQNNISEQSSEEELIKAYKLVLNDMFYNEENSPSLFRGIYDAKHGKQIYMYGISTVIEFIAYKISYEEGDKVSDIFINNMIQSENKINS